MKLKNLAVAAVATALLWGAATAPAQSANTAPQATGLNLSFGHSDAQQAVINFLGSHQAHRDAIRSLNQCRNCHQTTALDALNHVAAADLRPKGPWVGISVAPADGILRSQLRLPEGAGVVVTQVVPNGPAQQAGVRPHDILLAIDGEPVASGTDLDRLVRAAATRGAVQVKLLRNGKPAEVQVTPQTQDFVRWLEAAEAESKSVYRIGVTLSPPDETLRKQLNLGEAGVLVTDVNAGSPAEAAGLKGGDLLLSANGKSLTKEEELATEIRQGVGAPVKLEVMRGGGTLTLSAKPIKQPPPQLDRAAGEPVLLQSDLAERDLVLVHPNYVRLVTDSLNPTSQPAHVTADRLQQITEQLEQLRQTVDALRADIQRQSKESKP